jgi:hypothetical protein
MGRKVDYSLNAVLESKMQAIIADRFRGNYVLQHSLLQRRNGPKLRLRACQIPILDQIRAMQRRPLSHQAERARGELPSQHGQCLDSDQRLLA